MPKRTILATIQIDITNDSVPVNTMSHVDDEGFERVGTSRRLNLQQTTMVADVLV